MEISAETYEALLMGQSQGKQVEFNAEGYPFLRDPQPTAEELCARVDEAADAARRAVAGDPLRAVEYERAAAEAQTYADAGYQGAVPPMVAAWAINGRTARQAADNILGEAAQYNAALVQIRTVRLQAKELIRTLASSGDLAAAQEVAAETVSVIAEATAGIGNNRGS
ncbi:hypothetical protein D9M68_835950 [compost metagenome]